MLGFGPSYNKIVNFTKTKIDQNNSPELLNPLFKHIFYENIKQMQNMP